MSTARDDGRPDRRPDWLRRKHGHAPPRPRGKLDRWADKVVQILEGCQTGRHTVPWPDRASADEARKALNRAARRVGISIGAYLADPDSGLCSNCDRMHCQPSAKGQLVLHVNTFTKKDAYKYMLERYGPDTSKWPYIPGGRSPASPQHPPAAPSRPGERFGAGRTDRPPGPDEPPAGPKAFSGAPRPQQKAGTGEDAKTAKDPEEPEHEPLLTRLRRSLG